VVGIWPLIHNSVQVLLDGMPGALVELLVEFELSVFKQVICLSQVPECSLEEGAERPSKIVFCLMAQLEPIFPKGGNHAL